MWLPVMTAVTVMTVMTVLTVMTVMTVATATGELQCGDPSRCRLVGGAGSNFEREYEVDGKRLVIEFADSKHLFVKCEKGASLDSPALPSFESAVSVPAVTLAACLPPRGRSLAAALAALNASLTPHGNLSLTSLPARPALAAAHLAGLEALRALHLSAAGVRPPPAPSAGFLAPLRSLRSLALVAVRLPPAELAAAPRSLRALSLRGSGVRRLPAALAARLEAVALQEAELAPFAVPPRAQRVSLSSRNATVSLDAAEALESLALVGWWGQPAPGALARCGRLRSLQAVLPAPRALPAGWLAACPAVERVAVERARWLTALPAGWLPNATSLLHLSLRRTSLAALPPDLLLQAPNLLTLDLTDNRLRTLPSGAFSISRSVRSLQLASNELTSSVARLAGSLPELVELSLAHNPHLGDLCNDSYDYSPLLNLRKLTTLNLSYTGIRSICRDWRDLLTRLVTLDLRHSNVSELWYPELQFTRHESVRESSVRLEGAPVRSVRLLPADLRRALAAPPARATVHLGAPLACDCRMFLTALALRRAPASLRVRGLACAPLGRPLGQLDPRALQCPSREECLGAGLPAACACSRRPYDESSQRWLVTADCSGASRGAVPALRPVAGRYYRLLLQGNGISALRPADFSPAVVELDLRNNSLARVDGATAEALSGASHLGLRLAGNPLDCTCTGAALLQALAPPLEGGATVLDRLEAQCGGDLGPLRGALGRPPCPARLPPALWLAVALAATLAGAAACLACLASPQRRLLLEALLHRWGLLRRPAEIDAGCEYDVFVSYSHEDEKVAAEVARRLEGGPTPYRLCLHERDFVAGALISAQIEEAVARSRRTVALVSRAFLRSQWARAEVRAAQSRALREAAPRLVLVLLEAPAALPLDTELRRYVKTNTYVQWDDPCFWDKLRVALRSPSSAPAPAPAPYAAPRAPL